MGPRFRGNDRRALTALVPVLMLFTACPKPMTMVDAGKPPECEMRSDCSTGKICTAEQYCANCESSGQCSLKEVCGIDAGLCVTREGWGSECATNGDCQAGSWCKQGLCQPRSAVSLCPGGLNSECPQGFRCNKITTVCEEDLGCSTNDDCSAGEVCNVGSRACVPKCTVDTQSTICAGGEKCVNERCVQCAVTADCGPGLTCDAAGKCSSGTRCYSDRDCKIPLSCFVQTGACLPKQPPCVSNANCADDQRCDVRAGKCVPKTCQPDRYEPNDDAAHSFGVTAGTYRDLTLCLGDADWYGLTLARGDQVGVNMDADSFSENNFSSVIKDSTGRTVASGRLLVSYVAPTPGKYYAVISTIDPYQTYDVTFLQSRGTPCDDDTYEPNDSLTQPTVLNSSSMAEGKICPQDQDWYRVAVPTGMGVKVSLVNYDSSKGLLRLCLMSVDGMTETSCDDSSVPSVQDTAVNASGTSPMIRVQGTGDRIANGYTLKVEFL